VAAASGSFITRFFGRAASEGAAFALGTAVAPTLTPAVQELINEAWTIYPTLPMPFYQGARAEAMQVGASLDKRAEARKRGLGDAQWTTLVDVFRTYPEVSTLLELRRRGEIDDAFLKILLNRLGFSDTNAARIAVLQHVLLSAPDLAMMRQQGFITRDEQIADSARVGVSEAHADLLFEISGLPPGIETALAMLRRGFISEAEFGTIVREGHTKTKYTDELLAMRRQVLSAETYSRLRLKGWIDRAEANAGGALTGYEPAEMDKMYLSMGRPAAPGQMWTAAARGIDGPDGAPMNEAQFLKGIKESDIRPEWGPMLWGIRYLYPSLFQLTRLVTGGTIDAATGAAWAHKARYAPEVVTALRTSWEGGGTTSRDPHVVKAENQYWTALHRSYINREADDATVEAGLDLLGVPQGNHARIVNLWQHERDLIDRQLTPAQIKKAYQKVVQNPATGAPWTLEDAMAALLALGYSSNDATTFLEL
jgi:hypothetical protein